MGKLPNYAVYAASLNRAQQAYYLENKIFANTIKKLELDFQTRKYLIRTTDRAAFHQVESSITLFPGLKNGTPLFYTIFYSKQPLTYTVASAIFIMDNNESKETKWKTIICISDTPGWQELNEPFLQDGEPVCGQGTKQL